MAAVRHLRPLNVRNFINRYGSEANMRYLAKFCADWSNRCQDMAVFRFFKMVAVLHVGFLKERNFICLYTVQRVNMRRRAKFHADRSNMCGDIAVFRFFKDGGRPPSCICFTRVWIIHAR